MLWRAPELPGLFESKCYFDCGLDIGLAIFL